ncbi:hypothetical protein KA405_00610 [Patescibacteria group bacterium]|nr:hypothetical protein [Patescibacteria group bacterium]
MLYTSNQTHQILLEDIKRQLPADAILEKHFYDKELELIMKACKLSETQENRLSKHYGRARFHLIRMLRRSDIERKFSLAYMEYHDDIFQNDKENEQMMHSVISSE